MLSSAGHQQFEGFFVTRAAQFRWSFCTICDDERHVCLVTLLAVRLTHLSGVRLMASGAIGNLAMDIVTEGASESGVFALVLAQFLNLRSVAGEAWVGYVVTELDHLRGMRIGVAGKATIEGEVGFPFMTLATCRDDLLHCGGVSNVTILTGDVGFVCHTVCCDIGRSFTVAFNAVCAGQGSFFLPLGERDTCEH